MKRQIITSLALLSVGISLMPVCSAVIPDFSINYGYWTYKQSGDKVEFLVHVAGTSPGAEYMDIRFYTKYDNGTEIWTPWLRGPFDYGYGKNNNTTINALYFAPTADRWLAWEYLLDEVIPYNDSFKHVEEMRVQIEAYTDDGRWIETSSDMNLMPQKKEKDPRTGIPTDADINVHIKYAAIEYKDRGEFLDVNATIIGKGDNVSHVSLNFVITYKNGTEVASGWMGGPFNFGAGSKLGLNYSAYYFISDSGKWASWEFKLNGTIDKKYAPSVYWYDNMSSLKVYARAYLDNTEFLWNQDSKEVVLISENNRNEGSSGHLYPSLAVLVIALLAAGIALHLRNTKRK